MPVSPHINSHIDYFSARLPFPMMRSDDPYQDLPLPMHLFEPADIAPPIKRWSRGLNLFPGGRIYWNDGQREQGMYFVMSGADLYMVRHHHNITDDDLFDLISRRLLNTTRVDFAVTVGAGNFEDCVSEFKAGRSTCKARRVTLTDEIAQYPGGGVYFGSKKSDKFALVYDKAAELKLLNEVLTRVELRTKKRVSQNLFDAMLTAGVKAAGKAAIRQFADFPELEWYQQALEGREVDLALTPRKTTDFMAWLNEQVGPAIVKRAASQPDRERIIDWLCALQKEVGANCDGEKQH